MQKNLVKRDLLPQNKQLLIENYNKLKSELRGFWAEDIWDMSKCPIEKVELGHNKYRYIKFNCSNHYVNNEIKYAYWNKFENGNWKIKSFSHYSCPLNTINTWLNSLKLDVFSLTEISLNKLIMQLRSYLAKSNKSRHYTIKSLNKKQEPVKYKQEDINVVILRQIYKIIKNKYNSYEDKTLLEKDVWELEDLQALGCDIGGQCKRLNFKTIEQNWLITGSKKYIKFRLANHNTSVVNTELLAIKAFSNFLAKEYPDIKEIEITRQVIVNLLSYLSSLSIKVATRRLRITGIRNFLNITAREGFLKITKEQLIYNDDYPSKETSLPRFIPEEVLDQLNKNIDCLPPYIMRMTLVFQETGRRMSEIRHLPFDCLKQDGRGNFYLKHYQSKMKKEGLIPISKELVSVIKEQQESVTNEWGENQKYLFIVPKPYGKGQVISPSHYAKVLNNMAYEKNICDINGRLWRFQSHQFRHTVGTKMINMGVPIAVIMRYLGHESPEMTMIYARLHDETLRKEIEKYHASKVVNFQGEAAELGKTTLSSNDDLEWFKKNVQGRALEHGYCARPKVLGDCDIPGFDGCYNCPHWRTNKNFLPVLQDTLKRTNNVLQKAQNYGWQLQINKNIPIRNNLEKVIKSLEEDND
ncbi:MAG: tyrosine-type recombinase/integrase [Cyanobacteria bacterium P01_D01_bin.116]